MNYTIISGSNSIHLGKITIRNEDSIVQCRNKILVLSEDLNFSPVESTRIATAVSEICWELLKKEERSTVEVYIDKVNNRYGLLLVFREVPTQYDRIRLNFYLITQVSHPIKQCNSLLVL